MISGIITDIHNNVAALRSVLDRFHQIRCDRIICCGDIIGIGPSPEETVQEMMHIPGLISVQRNHEKYLLEGMPSEYPKPWKQAISTVATAGCGISSRV